MSRGCEPFKLSVSRNDFFFIPSPVARGMFRLLMPLNPGKENGYQPRFPAKPEARIRPEGWRFFLQEQRLTLLAKPLPYLCGDKRRLYRVRRVKVKRSTGRETEGSTSGTLTALPGLGIPKTGRPPATYVPVHVLALHGCENYKQGGNAFLPLYAKNPRFTATCTLPLP